MSIAFSTMDYISGVLAAGVKHELSSSVGFRGIARKITIFILVGIAHIVDKEFLGDTAFMREAVVFFYISNEGIAILENAVVIGIPIPEFLKERLLEFRNSKSKPRKNNSASITSINRAKYFLLFVFVKFSHIL